MGTVGTMEKTPENTRIKYPGETTATDTTVVGTGPPVYQETHYVGNLPSPMRTVATAMRKMTQET